MLKDLSRSLLGRLVSLGIFALGFWVLYQGLLREDNVLLLVLGVAAGSALILGGLYLMATTRRLAARRATEHDANLETEMPESETSHPELPQSELPQPELEDLTGDSLDGSRKGH